MLRLEKVCKTYTHGQVRTPALRDVSLVVSKGEFLVILGPSGSGKTTLLNVVSGLDTIDQGQIWFESQKISDFGEDAWSRFRREHLGFVFQQYNLLQNLTALENTRIGAEIGPRPRDAMQTLRQVGLGESCDKYPSQLSGGEQQRVSIARSIAKNPDLLFCDEPTGALDEATAKQVLGILETLNESLQLTLILITHNPAIAGMAHRVVRMNSGRIDSVKVNENRQKAADIHWG